MEYDPIEKLLPRAGGSVYRLVRMAANRALEIAEGKPRLVDRPSSEKATTIALEEILLGRVQYSGNPKKTEVKKKEEAE